MLARADLADTDRMTSDSEVLFLGGRSGVGKTSVGYELHAQLAATDIRHCLIEGDNLDQAHPPPAVHGLAEQNLTAMWHNYRRIGYRRLIYTNTASVRFIDDLVAAMGDRPQVTAVLLTSTDDTAHQRLRGREIGTALQHHLDRSDQAARELEQTAPGWVHRIGTDGRAVADIAAEIIAILGWAATTDHQRAAQDDAVG